MSRPDTEGLWYVFAALSALNHDIARDTRRKPCACVLPPDVAPGALTVMGLPVIRGPRTGLVYGLRMDPKDCDHPNTSAPSICTDCGAMVLESAESDVIK